MAKTNSPIQVALQLYLLADSLLLLHLEAFFARQSQLRSDVVAKVALLLFGQVASALQMLDRFVEQLQLKQTLSKKEMSLNQIRVHVKRPTTVLAGGVPLLQLQLTKRPIGEVGGHRRVLDLESNQS